MNRVTAYIERDPERNLYVGTVPGIPGAHTQADSLDELQANLKDVLELCLEEMDPEARWKKHYYPSPPRESSDSPLDKRGPERSGTYP
jgi:predicted RNase H-like HicB family nuclease